MNWLYKLLLLILLTSCVPDITKQNTNPETYKTVSAVKPNLPNNFLCLPVHKMPLPDTWGCGIPISSTEAITAGHVVEYEMQVFLERRRIGMRYVQDPQAEITIAGFQALLVSTTYTDEQAVTLKLQNNKRFPIWVSTAQASTGTAFVVQFDDLYEINITNINDQTFEGWKPYPGSSGCGIVQFIDNTWKLVGIVISRRCDMCITCSRQCDHCVPAGRFSTIPRSE